MAKKLKDLKMPKMRYMVLAMALIGMTAVGVPVHANWYTPSHDCDEPYSRSDQYEVESFRECIEEFVDEQNSAIRKHRRAANDAVDDWNSFAEGY